MSSSLLTGFLIGFPLAGSVGPIALLLMESGIQRGVRRSVPAVLGVATADLTLASVAAAGGAALVSTVQSARVPLTVLASVILIRVAVGLLRPAPAAEMAAATSGGAPTAGFARFLGLTLANPLTLLGFSSLVLAGGAATGSPGWVIGLAAGSMVAQVGFVVVGAAFGRALDERWTRRLRALAGVTILVVVGAQFLP